MADGKFIDRSYGKAFVKLLHVKRDGNVHSIREYEVSTLITLSSEKDYTQGDNADIIATDTQKNTVYLLAKKHGVGTPEQFAILVARHFLQTYSWVTKAEVKVEALRWSRIRQNHMHAFVAEPTYTRWAKVFIEGKDGTPKVTAGMEGLRLLKTTQSGFQNFVQDGYRSLPDTPDRVMSTVVDSYWTYRTLNNLDFCKAFSQVEKSILDHFAGPNDVGLYSSSVQKTVYDSQVEILHEIPQIEQIYMAFPNRHYFNVDLSKFPKSVGGCTGNNEVFMPVDKPSGYITSTLGRKDLLSKL